MNDPEVAAGQGRKAGSLSSQCVVLVIGAPATRTDSLLHVLGGLPTDISLTVVVAMQHPESFDEGGLRRGLGAQAETIATISDGAPVEPGRIYLPERGTLVTVEGGRFRTRPVEGASEGHATIDSLFVSLAADQDGHTIGLVLAGTGGDGVLGLAAVKEGGGLTLAEAEPDADGGKDARGQAPASASAMADFVLSADALPAHIAMHARQLAGMQMPPDGEAPLAGTALADALDRIAAVLLERTGHDFHGYKRPTFMRRVHRRMGVTGAERIEDYLDTLRGRPEEAQNLFNDLLIGVTRFFRDPREFEFLEREVVPKLFGSKGRGEQVRVWVLGCATGEEAYSIAILLREHAARIGSAPGVQIFATDLDTRALAVARVGRYPASIAQDVSPQRLARWFTEEGATYTVSRELRDACVFSQHSLVKDTPFSRLDLVSCRNLLIYLGPELQDRVIPLLHFGLESGGYLFLGASEGIARHGKLFAPVERGMHIFRKLDTGRRVLPDFPARAVVPVPVGSPVRPRPGPVEPGLLRRAERLAERHAPAYAVVDESHDVLQFSPRAGRYIHPAGGAASLGLLDLVHADLRLHLRAALGEAAQQGGTARADGIPLEIDGKRSAVDLVVEAIPGDDGAPGGFVVLFKDAALPPGANAAAGGEAAPVASVEHVRWLEAELRTTRERLRAMVEQLEGANEELKSSNEEYQSLNEELQSANEELATSKEELQSLNEELTTVNHELAHRVDELGRVNSDLKNLLQATRIATLFLDGRLRVTNFTPAAAQVFHLVEADLGRPIGHIKSRVAYDGLQEDVARVLDTLLPLEREVEEPGTGVRYMVRVLPYRSVDNVIAGTVVTFTDVTQVALAQEQVRDSEARLRLVTDRIPQFVWTAAGTGEWTWAGPQWTEYTGQAEPDSRGRGRLQMVHPDDHAAIEAAWLDAAEGGVLDVEHRVRAADGTYRWFHSRATPLAHGAGTDAIEWFGTSTDIHEMRELQERQAVLVAELQHRTRNLIAVVRSVAEKTLAGSASLEEFRTRFRDRLSALARVQGLLSRLSEGERVTFGALIRAELAALGALDADGRGTQVTLDGPADVRLRSAAVQTFALALHELATNAVKHGALSRPEGRLQVHWDLEQGEHGERRLRVEWEEAGVDVPAPAARSGYGRELIERALPYQLGAETRYELGPDGVRCTIVMPVSAEPGEKDARQG